MSTEQVVILDWGGGNLASVARAFERLGVRPRLSSEPEAVETCERLVFPGVGAFGAVMQGLETRRLIEPLKRRLSEPERPFLGICVGLQALFASSEESPGVSGLGIIETEVKRLRAKKVPHVGWNEILPQTDDDPFLRRGYAYFVNSYAAPVLQASAWKSAVTEHEHPFTSALHRGKILAVQFHPEKSSSYGHDLLQRWLTC